MNIKNEGAEAKLLENNILHLTWLNKGFTLENVKDMTLKIKKEYGNGPFLFLIDSRDVKNAPKPVRDYFRTPEILEIITASAMLVDNGISKIIANTTIMFIRPPYPIKMFLNMQVAIDWLLKQ